MISMTPRKHIPLSLTLLTPAVAIFLTLAVGAGIFGLLGFSPLGSLYTFFVAPISRPDQIGDLFVKACPLIITATGLVFCFRANVWNIGAEGQLVFGAIFSGLGGAEFSGLASNNTHAGNGLGKHYWRHMLGDDTGIFESQV